MELANVPGSNPPVAHDMQGIQANLGTHEGQAGLPPLTNLPMRTKTTLAINKNQPFQLKTMSTFQNQQIQEFEMTGKNINFQNPGINITAQSTSFSKPPIPSRNMRF